MPETRDAPPACPPFWVFGYGSLMWNPGFPWLERCPARLDGYRRAFALRSIRYRGTREAPGLVLGLDWRPGASCTGIAYRVCPTRDREVRDYLDRREMATRSYVEVICPVTLLGAGGPGPQVDALAYILDRTHPHYAGGLDLAAQAAIIARASGPAGPNADYLHNTVEHMRGIGLEDPDLFALDALVRARTGA